MYDSFYADWNSFKPLATDPAFVVTTHAGHGNHMTATASVGPETS